MNNSRQNNDIWLLRWEILRTIYPYVQWGLTDIQQHWNSILIILRSLFVQNHIAIKLLYLTKLMISPNFSLLHHWIHLLLVMHWLLLVLRHSRILLLHVSWLLRLILLHVLSLLLVLCLWLSLSWWFRFFIVSKDFVKHFLLIFLIKFN